MDAILELVDFDIVKGLWNFISAMFSFFTSFLSYIMDCCRYIYEVSPVIAVILLLACAMSIVLGILRIINLIPLL